MRIVSLLPSATEMVYALGLGDSLVGVTHECDWPPDASRKQVVSHSNLPEDAPPAEIDRLVSESMVGGEPTYRLDAEAIRELRPDLVLTQDLCAVCAVPAGDVHAALDVLGCRAEVVSLDPSSLEDVLHGLVEIGRVTGTEVQAQGVVRSLRARLHATERAVAGLGRPKTFALEWGDPPFNGGHWVPEMIEVAGGEPVLGAHRTPSVRVTWDQIAAADPDVVVFMPCGYGLDAAVAEAEVLVERPEFPPGAACYAVHANAYFSRPGPRLVDGVEILASALHPDAVSTYTPPARSIARVR